MMTTDLDRFRSNGSSIWITYSEVIMADLAFDSQVMPAVSGVFILTDHVKRYTDSTNVSADERGMSRYHCIIPGGVQCVAQMI